MVSGGSSLVCLLVALSPAHDMKCPSSCDVRLRSAVAYGSLALGRSSSKAVCARVQLDKGRSQSVLPTSLAFGAGEE